ncbi:hypothetical protein Tco_0989457 [Tanacetum coccineum]|uniref:Uncharacterized protein n=1 Tax=Tanacetum coccineum TaxID=301880 RepID=A0ABQ5ETP6_9ASTR
MVEATSSARDSRLPLPSRGKMWSLLSFHPPFLEFCHGDLISSHKVLRRLPILLFDVMELYGIFDVLLLLKIDLLAARSLINKALDNPVLLGEPIKNLVHYDDDEGFDGNVYKPNAKRQNFVLDSKSEDLSLTTLSLQFYEPRIRGMNQCKMGSTWYFESVSLLRK